MKRLSNFTAKIIKSFSISILIAACGSGRQVKTIETPIAGGPCAYKEETKKASFLSISTKGNGQYDALFLVPASADATKNDTISLSQVNEREGYTKNEIDSLKLVQGKMYGYKIQTITSGTCTPRIATLTLTGN